MSTATVQRAAGSSRERPAIQIDRTMSAATNSRAAIRAISPDRLDRWRGPPAHSSDRLPISGTEAGYRPVAQACSGPAADRTYPSLGYGRGRVEAIGPVGPGAEVGRGSLGGL